MADEIPDWVRQLPDAQDGVRGDARASWYETASLQVSEFREEWCPACQRSTLQCGDILAMTSQSVRRIGGFAVCAECGWSPADEEKLRGRTTT